MPLRLAHIEFAPEGPETGPPLLIAHGLFGSARNFSTLGRRLAQGRRVVAVDMRNHGASPWGEATDYLAQAGDLAEAVERLCGGEAAVMGHSMGGKAAMALALAEPARVAALVVADIAPAAYGHSHLAIVRAMRAADISGVRRRSEGEALLASAVDEPQLRAFLLQNLVIEDGGACWRLNLAALEAGMDALIGWPEALAGARFDGPALFVHGGASDYVRPGHGPAIRAHFPSAEMREVPGAGHWLHAEKPAEFLAATAPWLDAPG